MSDPRPVFFFDIDNCLYSRSIKVHERTSTLVQKFIETALSLDQGAANELHSKYRNEYSMTVEGLAQHHGIDPLEYNRHVDDALPLEDLLEPDPELHKMLRDIDRSKVKLWLFTNAYVSHGKRVVRLLGIEDQFEGLTYCDYGANPMHCKPHSEMFKKAMKEAGAADVKACYFVDDSAGHCHLAEKMGWTTVHLLEDDAQLPEGYVCKYSITGLVDLRELFPQFFIEQA
ncbi:pyrimidine 5'-nucleotidase-like protein [Lasiosphaeris hirsuta]|uniref:Pyrimidine 5'-nucleotidase-like protein n=1 Tax=Lasiosphaeris hirsuta TaxID=260670 RepID=A0AA40A341_9PEZI|nr:pyrimidine 5'-nucleotidase-like protein [Lasiosphaeris hirsuta]